MTTVHVCVCGSMCVWCVRLLEGGYVDVGVYVCYYERGCGCMGACMSLPLSGTKYIDAFICGVGAFKPLLPIKDRPALVNESFLSSF